MKISGLFLMLTCFLLLNCNRKLLMPLSDGVFQQKNNTSYNHDVNFFIYPDSSLNVLASENCEIKMIQKIDDEFYIIAIGKYEISYALLSEIFIKEGEKIKRGEKIGKLRKAPEGDPNSPSYLTVTIKDNKGHYIENHDIFFK